MPVPKQDDQKSPNLIYTPSALLIQLYIGLFSKPEGEDMPRINPPPPLFTASFSLYHKFFQTLELRKLLDIYRSMRAHF